MPFLNELSLGFSPTLPVILQTEATECGLACLAMVASFHRHHTDLMTLRRRFSISLKGATLSDVIQIAQKLNMGTRPIKLDLEELDQLKLPCILHWNFNHFVVLKEVNAKTVVIHDPAIGARTLSWGEVSASFTGVALEIWPGAEFKPAKKIPTIRLRQLMGRVSGLQCSPHPNPDTSLGIGNLRTDFTVFPAVGRRQRVGHSRPRFVDYVGTRLRFAYADAAICHHRTELGDPLHGHHLEPAMVRQCIHASNQVASAVL